MNILKNKFEFVFPYNKAKTVELILKNTRRPEFISNDNIIYAKISKDSSRITLYHGITYRNSFLPIFNMRLIEDNEKNTIAIGCFRWSGFTVAFLIWFLFFIFNNFVSGIITKNITTVITAFFEVVFLIFISAIGVFIERKHVKKIIKYLRNIEKGYEEHSNTV